MNTTIKRVVTNFVIKVEPPSTGHSKYQTFSNSGKNQTAGTIYYKIFMKKPSGSGQ